LRIDQHEIGVRGLNAPDAVLHQHDELAPYLVTEPATPLLKTYLAKIVDLAKQVKDGPAAQNYPATITSPAQRSLYDNLNQDADLSLRLDAAIRSVKKDGWRGHPFKEKEVRRAIAQITNDQAQAELVFGLAVAQRDY